jgi:hypothetical protein
MAIVLYDTYLLLHHKSVLAVSCNIIPRHSGDPSAHVMWRLPMIHSVHQTIHILHTLLHNQSRTHPQFLIALSATALKEVGCKLGFDSFAESLWMASQPIANIIYA